jgi:epoxyqueuosine reductase
MSIGGLELQHALARRGWPVRVVRADRTADLRRAIEGLRSEGLLDETFAGERLGFFSYDPPAEVPEARSLIVLAVPAPAVRLTFHWRGEPRPASLPPTYAGYSRTTRRAQDEVSALLGASGWRTSRPLLPLKTLAVRSGLGEYGRNNICYVNGLGSYAQLVGLFSDMPCAEDDWCEARMLARCESCAACRKACCGGAIPEDRFLLRAERCLAYHSERAGRFPSWFETGWHHTLMGCMDCQRVCPEDKPFHGWIVQGEEFTEQETELLLAGAARPDIPEGLAEKLARLDLLDDLAILGRNLSVLLARGDAS